MMDIENIAPFCDDIWLQRWYYDRDVEFKITLK